MASHLVTLLRDAKNFCKAKLRNLSKTNMPSQLGYVRLCLRTCTCHWDKHNTPKSKCSIVISSQKKEQNANSIVV